MGILTRVLTALSIAVCGVLGVVSSASAATTGPETVATGTFMRNIAFTPDSAQVWITSYSAKELVGYTTDSAQTRIRTISLPGIPEGVVVLADGIHALVPFSDLNDVGYINLATGVVTRPFAVNSDAYPADIALSPDGNYVGVSYFFGQAVAMYRTSDWALVQRWSLPGWASTVAFTADSNSMTVTDFQNDQVHVLTRGSATVVDVSVGRQPFGQLLAPDGSSFVVLNSGAGTAIQFMGGNVRTGIPAMRVSGQGAQFASFTPDSSQVWVAALGENNVRIFNSSDWSEQSPLSIPGGPRQVQFSPNGCLAYVALENANTVVRYHLAPCLAASSSGGSQGGSFASGSGAVSAAELARTGASPANSMLVGALTVAVMTIIAGSLAVVRGRRP